MALVPNQTLRKQTPITAYLYQNKVCMAGRMNLSDKKAMAQELTLNTDKTGKEIAQIVKITEKTYSKWKREGDWDLLKQASTVTAANIINNLYKQAHDLSLEDAVNADKLVKIANTIEKLSNRRTTVSSIINVFKDFTSWAYGQEPELAKQINDLQRKYVDYKINEK